MSKKKKQQTDVGVENVDRALTRAEQFIEDNQKSLSIAAGIILGVIAVIFGFRKFYLAPTEIEAQSQIFYAEKYFEIDSFNLALYGDNNNLGFIDIIDNYGITKTANLAKYYAGICNLRMGYYEDAIEYLKKYKIKDEMLATVALGAIGDAYVELDDLENGVEYYDKATEIKANNFTTPIYLMKAGQVYEELAEYEKALEKYNRILQEFMSTDYGRDIEKHIARTEALLAKE